MSQLKDDGPGSTNKYTGGRDGATWQVVLRAKYGDCVSTLSKGFDKLNAIFY